jgi:hypothetical protein
MFQDDDELLRRYLLQELSEEEEERLVRRLLQDDDLGERLDAIGTDLLAAYDRGELAAEEEHRIEALLTSSDRLRSRLALVRAIRREAGRGSGVIPFLQRTWYVPAALAAALLAAVLVPTVLEEIQDGKARDLTTRIGTPPAITRTATPSPAPAVPGSEPERRAEATPAQTPTPTPDRPPAPSVVEPQVVSQVVTLALARLRAGEELPPIVIPRDVQEVRFQLLPREKASAYRVVLRHGETTVAEREVLPQREEGGVALHLEVPAADLQPGIYEVEVRGVGAEFPERGGFEIQKESM